MCRADFLDQKQIKPGGKWSDKRLIIFTEYRGTQNCLYNLLAQEKLAESGRLMKLFGGMDPEDREAIKAAFQAGPQDKTVWQLKRPFEVRSGTRGLRHAPRRWVSAST